MEKQLHHIDIATIELSLDVLKFALNRITFENPEIGAPITYEDLKAKVGDTITPEGIGGEKAFDLYKKHLLPATIPIVHPKHLAFVPAAPSRASLMFDLVTSVSSIHGSYWMEGAGGIFCEMEAMQWLVSMTGMPEGSFGVFTTGGTSANLSAIVVARDTWRRLDPDRKGKKGIIMTSEGAHSSIKSMANVIDAELKVVSGEGKLGYKALEECWTQLSSEDQKRVFAVVATAGTTNAGIIDDLKGIADFCHEKEIWFHIDGAYGGAALLVDSVRHLFDGVERCDSFTIDPHKWLFTPYDCGAIIYKNPALAKATHAQQGSYLDIFNEKEMDGFNPSDYQVQLTRRLRGMPLWFSLAMHGTDVYKEAVTKGITLALEAAQLIENHDKLELIMPPNLSVVLFRRKGWTPDDYKKWTYKNHREKTAFVTPTKVKSDNIYETVIRFCFINPDTSIEHVQQILDTIE